MDESLINILLGIFVVLQLADAYTTNKALQIKGPKEKNPLISFLAERIGIVPALILSKAVLLGITFYFIVDSFEGILAMSFLNALYLFVVYNNYKVGKKYGTY